MTIPVFIRGHSQTIPSTGAQSGTSVTPSVTAGISEEQISSHVKRVSRGRLSSVGQSVIISGIAALDHDNRSIATTGNGIKRDEYRSRICRFQFTNRRGWPYRSRTIASVWSVIVSSFARSYWSILWEMNMRLLNTSLPCTWKVLGRSGHRSYAITCIVVGWRLDLRFIDILKRILPLQEHLHTLKYLFHCHFCLHSLPFHRLASFSYIGLSEQTLRGLVDLCQSIKNLK